MNREDLYPTDGQALKALGVSPQNRVTLSNHERSLMVITVDNAVKKIVADLEATLDSAPWSMRIGAVEKFIEALKKLTEE